MLQERIALETCGFKSDADAGKESLAMKHASNRPAEL